MQTTTEVSTLGPPTPVHFLRSICHCPLVFVMCHLTLALEASWDAAIQALRGSCLYSPRFLFSYSFSVTHKCPV